jgi:murein DD-endopeptidase MepM/ murein hydrolase activator NlpD
LVVPLIETDAPSSVARSVSSDPLSIEIALAEDIAAVEPELSLDTSRPKDWQPKVRRCALRGSRHFCDGPRMVPVAEGEDAERASALGLGEMRTASHLMVRAPEARWMEAIEGEAHGSLLFPVEEGHMGRGFGYVRRSEIRHIRHDGVDIPAPLGAKVRAVDDGIVAYADNGVRGYGNLVLVVHEDGGTSLYAHLSAAYFFAGQRVRRGQVIGEVGNTGLSYAPHLHFEYRKNGRLADPAPLFVEIPVRGRGLDTVTDAPDASHLAEAEVDADAAHHDHG